VDDQVEARGVPVLRLPGQRHTTAPRSRWLWTSTRCRLPALSALALNTRAFCLGLSQHCSDTSIRAGGVELISLDPRRHDQAVIAPASATLPLDPSAFGLGFPQHGNDALISARALHLGEINDNCRRRSLKLTMLRH
jgi:hypothetical protein